MYSSYAGSGGSLGYHWFGASCGHPVRPPGETLGDIWPKAGFASGPMLAPTGMSDGCVSNISLMSHIVQNLVSHKLSARIRILIALSNLMLCIVSDTESL